MTLHRLVSCEPRGRIDEDSMIEAGDVYGGREVRLGDLRSVLHGQCCQLWFHRFGQNALVILRRSSCFSGKCGGE